MPLDVEAITEIRATAPEVARWMFDPNQDTRWIQGIASAELLTPPPVRTGSAVRRVARFLGKRIEYVLQVEVLQSDRLLHMSSLKSPFPMQVTYALEPLADGGTLAAVRVRGTGNGHFGIADSLMAGFVRRNVARDLRNLKYLVEGAEGGRRPG